MTGIVSMVGGGYLERLISEDYGAKVSGEAKEAMTQFLRTKPSIGDINLVDAQRVLRIANQILRSDPDSIDGLADRVYMYNIQAIRRVEEALATASLKPAQRQHMRAWKVYMYANAGAAARQEFNTTQEITWEEKAYDAHCSSAEESKTLNPRHSAYMHRLAGNDASEVSRVRRTQEWRSRAISCYESFLDYCRAHPEEPQGPISAAKRQIEFLSSLNSYAQAAKPPVHPAGNQSRDGSKWRNGRDHGHNGRRHHRR